MGVVGGGDNKPRLWVKGSWRMGQNSGNTVRDQRCLGQILCVTLAHHQGKL